MDVFLVPLGADQYEPYTEEADIDEEPEEESLPEGFFARLRVRSSPARLKLQFSQMLAAAERERRRDAASRAQDAWAARMKSRAMRWIAETIAEQRLLWNLRGVDEACLAYPDDMTEAAAVTVLRKQLASDFDKHRFWLAVDSVLMVVIRGPGSRPGTKCRRLLLRLPRGRPLLLRPGCAQGPERGHVDVFAECAADRTASARERRSGGTARTRRAGGRTVEPRSLRYVLPAHQRSPPLERYTFLIETPRARRTPRVPSRRRRGP